VVSVQRAGPTQSRSRYKVKRAERASKGRGAAKEGGRMRDDVARESGWLPKEETKTVLKAPGRVGSGFMAVAGRESQ
jgi:hypothetical protein